MLPPIRGVLLLLRKLVTSGSAPNNAAIVKSVMIIKPLVKRKIPPVIAICTVGLNKYMDLLPFSTVEEIAFISK